MRKSNDLRALQRYYFIVYSSECLFKITLNFFYFIFDSAAAKIASFSSMQKTYNAIEFFSKKKLRFTDLFSISQLINALARAMSVFMITSQNFTIFQIIS